MTIAIRYKVTKCVDLKKQKKKSIALSYSHHVFLTCSRFSFCLFTKFVILPLSNYHTNIKVNPKLFD